MGKVKTGIVMMNLGGPANLDEVEPFLLELFADREIIQLPFQSWLGPFIARRRTPRVKGLYANIGGGSPILRYTRAQGQGMVERLDRLSPETAPHQFYVAFRYVKPKSEDALRAMPPTAWSARSPSLSIPSSPAATTGSSLNELWRAASRTGLRTRSAGASSTAGPCTRGSSRRWPKPSGKGWRDSIRRSETTWFCSSVPTRCR